MNYYQEKFNQLHKQTILCAKNQRKRFFFTNYSVGLLIAVFCMCIDGSQDPWAFTTDHMSIWWSWILSFIIFLCTGWLISSFRQKKDNELDDYARHFALEYYIKDFILALEKQVGGVLTPGTTTKILNLTNSYSWFDQHKWRFCIPVIELNCEMNPGNEFVSIVYDNHIHYLRKIIYDEKGTFVCYLNEKLFGKDLIPVQLKALSH